MTGDLHLNKSTLRRCFNLVNKRSLLDMSFLELVIISVSQSNIMSRREIFNDIHRSMSRFWMLGIEVNRTKAVCKPTTGQRSLLL